MIKFTLILYFGAVATLFYITLHKSSPIGIQSSEISNNGIFHNSKISETEFEYNFDYNQLFQQMNLNKSAFFGIPFVASIFRTRHIFRSLSNFVDAIGENNLVAEKVKCGDIVFVKTDYIRKFLEKIHPDIKNPYILITHESDHTVVYPWQMKYLNDSKIIVWYAQNVIVSHPKLKPIPIGVVPPKNEVFSTLYENAKNLMPFLNRTLLLYLNFSPTTNKNRTKTLNYFKTTFANNSGVKIDEAKMTWKKYLLNLGNSKFVLSPPGNGIDCHRTWEALAMGAVPIVLKSDLMPLYANLPIMVVNDWKEVTEKTLQKFQNEHLKNGILGKDGIPLRPKIWLRYWIKEIVDTKVDYIKQSC